jgi:exodeoxyribonuclease V alpha subunit
MSNTTNKQVEFIGRVERQIYSSEDYKMYSALVDKDKYPNIKFTKYGSATIAGNLHSLTPGTEYLIKATEKMGTKGYIYNVINIRKTDLKTEGDVYDFLQEILTFNQASELYRVYPNIVDLVMSGKADEKVDLSKLKGIKEYTFKKVKEKIIKNFALFDLINEFGGVLTMGMMKKLYEAYPSIEKIRSALRERPYTSLCSLSRVGFKTADKMLLDMEKENKLEFSFDLRNSKERCLACMMYLLEENEINGHTKMSIPELRKQVMKLTPACSNHFVNCINGNKDIYYNKDDMSISLMKTYQTELKISNIIKNGLLNKQVWNIDWKSYRTKGEYELSDEQLNSLKLICEEQIVILCGFAGSGKTATTNTLIKLLEDNRKTFVLCSPTGRAAKVLGSYTGKPAGTIHRTYLYNPKEGWKYNEENKIDVDIVICDETSMTDIFLFLHLLDGIDFSRTKLFLIGDPAQLCSVAAGNVLNDLIESGKLPVSTLTKIFRYNEGGLMQVATDTRNSKVFLSEKSDKFIFFGKNKDYAFLQCNNENIIKRTSALYEKLLSQGYNPEDILVLTSQNKGDCGTVAINQCLQKIANKNYGSGDYMKIGETVYYIGDIVLQTVNNYRALLYDEDMIFDNEEKETLIANGELGVIKEITLSYAIIDFDGTVVKYFRENMQNIAHGYSLTTHKSQGGSAKIVIFITPAAHTFMLSSNLLYVGLTRTKERCFHLGDMATVNRAIKKKENVNRNTFLFSMLKSE